jgi:hypothetical protein
MADNILGFDSSSSYGLTTAIDPGINVVKSELDSKMDYRVIDTFIPRAAGSDAKIKIVTATGDIVLGPTESSGSDCLATTNTIIIGPGMKAIIDGVEKTNNLGNCNLHIEHAAIKKIKAELVTRYPFLSSEQNATPDDTIKFQFNGKLRPIRSPSNNIITEIHLPSKCGVLLQHDTGSQCYLRNLTYKTHIYNCNQSTDGHQGSWKLISQFVYDNQPTPTWGTNTKTNPQGIPPNQTTTVTKNGMPVNIYTTGASTTVKLQSNTIIIGYNEPNYQGQFKMYGTAFGLKTVTLGEYSKSYKIVPYFSHFNVYPKYRIHNKSPSVGISSTIDKCKKLGLKPVRFTGVDKSMNNYYTFDKEDVDQSGCGDIAMTGLSYGIDEQGRFYKEYMCDPNYTFDSQSRSDVKDVKDFADAGTKLSYHRYTIGDCGGPLVNISYQKDPFKKDKGRVKYRCGKMEMNDGEMREISYRADKDATGDDFVNEMTQMNFKCNENELLTRIRLRDKSDKAYYEYTCAKPKQVEGFFSINNDNHILFIILLLVLVFFVFTKKMNK